MEVFHNGHALPPLTEPGEGISQIFIVKNLAEFLEVKPPHVRESSKTMAPKTYHQELSIHNLQPFIKVFKFMDSAASPPDSKANRIPLDALSLQFGGKEFVL